jgi:hypothetical protein
MDNSRLAVKIGVIAGIISAALPSVPTIYANRHNPEYIRVVVIMTLVAGGVILWLWSED